MDYNCLIFHNIRYSGWPHTTPILSKNSNHEVKIGSIQRSISNPTEFDIYAPNLYERAAITVAEINVAEMPKNKKNSHFAIND